MTDKELVMKLEEDISWLEQGCTTEKEICEHIKQAKETIIHHKETASPWHTGTPTEGGLFLVYMKGGYYDVCEFNDDYERWDIGFKGVVAWQKIEPYKETDYE